MPEFRLRKLSITIEEIHHDGGPDAPQPRQRAAIVALVSNPFAGRFAADITGAMEDLKPLGLMMTDRLIAALGGREGIDSYGKAAICGEAGELEHTALWHVPGGYAMRARLGEARAIVPSSMKMAGIGSRIDIPMGHINAAYVRSHFDSMEVGAPDGPRAHEILFALAMGRGPRVHARMGGLAVADVKGEDGLR